MGEAVRGAMLPFFGTALGSALVFFLRGEISPPVRRALSGFAAGVMTAASVWSLLLPAIEQSAALGAWAFVPAAGGFWLGAVFLWLLDAVAPGRGDRLLLAVTIHNIPEGMAVGVVYGALLSGRAGVTAPGAMSLALGIALQNLPEGAIISLPLHARGMGRARAFGYGVLSGAVEPLGAALMLALSGLGAAMPWFLGFAAGAMILAVVRELVPEMNGDAPSNAGTLMFTAGFTLMLAMDVGLG